MSETLIASQQSEINRLNKLLAETGEEARKHRKAKAEAVKELNDARASLASAEKDRDGWRSKAEAGPAEVQGRIAELEGEVTKRDHRDAFAALRDDKDVGLNPGVKVDALWALLGYKPEGAPDPAAIKALVVAARQDHGYLFGQGGGPATAGAPGGTQQPTRPPLAVQGVASRGDRDAAGRQFRVSRAEMRDPAFMLDPARKAAMAEARKAGTLTIVD